LLSLLFNRVAGGGAFGLKTTDVELLKFGETLICSPNQAGSPTNIRNWRLTSFFA
jgi:hypothetical protein